MLFLQAIFQSYNGVTSSVFDSESSVHTVPLPLDARMIPAYVSAASAVLLLTYYVTTRFLKKSGGPVYVSDYGRTSILMYNIARLASVLALLALSIVSLVRSTAGNGSPVVYAISCAVYGYATVLSLVTVLTKPSTTRGVSPALTVILLTTFCVYAYRDLWPLMTFTLEPLDEDDGKLLWAKIALLAYSGVIIPITIPRAYEPYDPLEPSSKPAAEQTASIASMVTFWFMEPLVFLAYRLPRLPYDQIPPLADYDWAKNLVDRSAKHLDVYAGAPKRHLFFGLMRVFAFEYTSVALMIVIRAVTAFIAPLGMQQLLQYLETGGDDALVRPWAWIALLCLGPFLNTLAMQWYTYNTTAVVMRGEAILTELVFQHALRVRMKAETKSNEEGQAGKEADNIVGKITNLVTTDVDNIVDARDFLTLVLLTPLHIAFSIWMLYSLLGWSSFVGVAVMLAFLPIPGAIAKNIQRVQREVMKHTDARVQVVTEMMNIIRSVKLFGWEQKIGQLVYNKREDELHWMYKREFLTLGNMLVNYIAPIIVMVASYGAYTILMKANLTPSVVFSSMVVFDLLRDRLKLVSRFTPLVVKARVSLDRVNAFLHTTELLDEYSEQLDNANVVVPNGNVLGMRNAQFTWSKDDTATNGSSTPSSLRFALRVADEIIFKRGAFNIVVGPTGCGKTSLLMALLGELHFSPLGPDAWVNLPRASGVAAYAAQESWVQNETIRDNIVFGAPFDEGRYNKVIYQCGLKRDLELFEAGDKTEVGEKGLTLSGGQKARVTLARAIYSRADTLLLDDVLSALDVHTARWIVDKCFKGDLVRGRTVVLVTHNVALVGSLADYVVSLNNGSVASHGEPDETIKKDDSLLQEAQEEDEVMDKADQEIDTSTPDAKDDSGAGKLILAEEVQEGRISLDAWNIFFGNLGGNHSISFWTVFLGFLTLSQVLSSGQAYFMGIWSEQYDRQPASEVNAAFYLGIVVLIMLGSCLTYAGGNYTYIFGIIRAVRKIHKELVESILGTTLRTLDTTPVSRFITRCTQDIRSVESVTAHEFQFLLEVTLSMVIKLGAVVMLTPIFLIPGVLVAVLGGWIGQVYLAANMSVIREMNKARSPVLGHFGAAIAGLVSIRAYGSQHAFHHELHKRIDHYNRAVRTMYNVNRWVGIRIDGCALVFEAAVAAYLVYGPGHEKILPSQVGFSLTMAVGFSSLILWWVRIFNAMESNANCLERLRAYMTIEQELKPIQEKIPPASWPTSGDLRVEKLSARYSPDGPRVLHEISFEVKSGERVGIVGRTGSGKSSLTLSLLRCIFNEGSIFYDGADTANINLDTLRSSITIIPQVPELLSGTLRENLDPFSEHDDATLNSALRAAGLFSLQTDDDENRITLDSQISSGGGNMSVGQRQILALARALVRGSKLLILDEATSSIDYETDTIIQKSLRNELGGDVTLLTVAHRLQTIMDADKIMVLDAGRIVEFDAPGVLLQKESGYFRSLVDESGDKEALCAMVRGK
ncbi:P-loop containing nucleoside triphosphate hydrolase protein [Peniophora sp. CONT]|nr:P-loop containing nucleoside triphosphate hydrolase protein [Peniophora sp. CONT]